MKEEAAGRNFDVTSVVPYLGEGKESTLVLVNTASLLQVTGLKI